MSDQPMREMRSDELVEAMENLHQYPRLIAERAYAEGLAAATPAPLGECGYDEPHEPHTYVLAENDRPVDHECPGLDATPAPLMDIQKQSVVTTAPLDVPGHVHPGHILCAACVNNGMSAASAAERPATPNSYEKWIRPKVAATPAPLDVLVAALEAIDAKVQKYAEQEADSAAHKEWTLADRWRYLAMGNAEAVESIRAAHKENRGE